VSKDWRPAWPWDAAVAVALFGLGLYEVLGQPIADDVVEGSVALNVAALALATLPLAWRRTFPLATALVVYAAVAGRALAAEPLEIYSATLSMLIATYSVAGYARFADAVAAAVAGGLAIAIAIVEGSGGDATPDPVAAPILFGSVWIIGRVAHVRDARAGETARRAEALDRLREAREAEAAAAEREGLARELHDAVSHSLASIVMQAGGAQDVLDTEPAKARASLESIERAAREGVSEMRRLLSISDRNGESPTLVPQPGLDRMGALVRGAREAGLDVHATTAGEPQRLPPAIEASAYRILQESLTNVMKHAGPCRVELEVCYGASELKLEVADDGGRRSAEPGLGEARGLVGMRKRVAMLGGSFEAGPRVDTPGFRVSARLPLEPPP
jgi:signal transduction histidine kinase